MVHRRSCRSSSRKNSVRLHLKWHPLPSIDQAPSFGSQLASRSKAPRINQTPDPPGHILLRGGISRLANAAPPDWNFEGWNVQRCLRRIPRALRVSTSARRHGGRDSEIVSKDPGLCLAPKIGHLIFSQVRYARLVAIAGARKRTTTPSVCSSVPSNSGIGTDRSTKTQQ
jgi:hypothetical protein